MRVMLMAAAFAVGAGAATAQPVEADWPCEQRRILHLSIGQMWAADLPDDLDAWRDDRELADLAARIAARRTTDAEVNAMIAGVSAQDGVSREARLARLFTGVFALIDAERARIVEGISRYARRQAALADRIETAQDALAQAEAAAAPDDFDALDRIDRMRDTLAWDVRIFDERDRSLGFVCESPVILERRAFAVARAIKAGIDG
ncbi:MAG: hypothetical protein EA355_07920 [Rhodobacteraceae bacterium]|nr:MAG: hypothetical protein EA355_07920 [Paracoccaceae bacterium]